MFISRETLDDVLLALYPLLLERSTDTVVATRGETAEIIGALIEIEQPRARLSRSETRGKLFSSLGELLWYLSRDNRLDLAAIQKEIPCTTTLQFFVRNERLDMVTTMRSNDAYLGLPHDVFCFTMLQEIIARSLGLDIGV